MFVPVEVSRLATNQDRGASAELLTVSGSPYSNNRCVVMLDPGVFPNLVEGPSTAVPGGAVG